MDGAISLSSGPPSPVAASTAQVSGGGVPSLHDAIWQAPLVPAAIALTAGIVLDRYLHVPLAFTLRVAAASLIAWMVMIRFGSSPGLPLAYLAVAFALLGAAYHHAHRDVYADDDIGNYVSDNPRPARLLGILAEEPAIVLHRPDPLQSYTRSN